MKNLNAHRRSGFTLIELLTVIAIIGILAAIIIPTTGAVRTAAKKAQVKTMFSNWSNAYSLYKQEYGYYPLVGTSNKVSDANDTIKFVRTFTGKNINGSAVATVTDLNGNKRRQSFLSLSDSELPAATSLLTDAFGNEQFGILVDVNGDGVIKPADDGTPQPVASKDTGTNFTPTTGSTTSDIPTDGVRAGVIFYSAGKDGGTSNAVMSWK